MRAIARGWTSRWAAVSPAVRYNGHEFSRTFRRLGRRAPVANFYIQPANPNQNGFIERFNRSRRTTHPSSTHPGTPRDRWSGGFAVHHARPHDRLDRPEATLAFLPMPRQYGMTG